MKTFILLAATAAAAFGVSKAPAPWDAALLDATLRGRVEDAGTGQPVARAHVFVPGSSHSTTSADDGTFALVLPDAWIGTEITVRVERLGYHPTEATVLFGGTATTLTVALTAGTEIVVVPGDPRSLPERERAEALVDFAAEMDATGYPAAQATRMATTSGFMVPAPPGRTAYDTEAYAHVAEGGFLTVAASPLSTFSIDVDRASYANVRRFLNEGRLPPVDAVRVEELINYFPYDYLTADGDHPFNLTTEVSQAPWQPAHRLVRVGLQAEHVDTEDMPPNNLVFLLDVSGSMDAPDKLPLLKTALRMLVAQLRPQDRVAIVVYAGAAGLVLPSTPGSDRLTILQALESLSAGGSTAGGAGLQLAYDVAREGHVEGGNNRVILATDGDFNVGPSSDGEMVRLIEARREQGTYLSVLGFGAGNLKDSKMEALADHGNGNYAYIDGVLEARKQLVAEMGGTLLTVAKDVKIQVEFNPATVREYRLIGYENRMLASEDFNDDTKDAGELGAGHSVTALYEVVPVGAPVTGTSRSVDPLRYQPVDEAAPRTLDSDELLHVKVRYKRPDESASRLLARPVVDGRGRPSTDLRFAASVAAFGMILRGSDHCGDFTLDQVAALAREGRGDDPDGYRAEFIRLVETARDLAATGMEGR